MDMPLQAGSQWAAFLPFYEAARKAPPGSVEERIAERALNYAVEAVSSGRFSDSQPDHSVRNHLRNARHNEYRSGRSARERQQRLRAAAGPSGHGLGWTSRENVPESTALAAEIVEELRAELANSPGALRVLDAMLADLSVEDTQTAFELSERTVKRLRSRVRSSATLILAA